MPGALPPTPGASEGISTAPDPDDMSDSYVIVELEADLMKDGDVAPPPPPRSNARAKAQPETDSDDSS
jgi:hypothetical protein